MLFRVGWGLLLVGVCAPGVVCHIVGCLEQHVPGYARHLMTTMMTALPVWGGVGGGG